ncbi:MAG: amidohydrolase [Vulcanisaeta sp. AZ3]|jgi:cytosine/adenosine deaminase-related metal-dependent hydrolase
MATLLLRNCKFAIDWTGDELRVLRNIDVLIKDGVIENIGVKPWGDYEEIDCSSSILMPGLVNAHTHTPMSLMRGFYDDAELMDWLNKMWSVERELTPEIISLGSELSIIESIMSGSTALVDMYMYPEATAEVAIKYGIRMALGPVFMDTMFNPTRVENDLRNFTAMYSNNPLIKTIINIHSVYTCSKDTLERARNLSRELNTNIQIHISETRDEVYSTWSKWNMFPIDYLDGLGLLTPRTQLVHLGWVTNWELGKIARAGSIVTHAPTSNMKMATAGHFPMREIMDMGIIVTLGTDGPGSNNSLDMFREMKNAVLLQRHSYWDVSIKAIHALKAATINGYKLLNIKGGCASPGCIADLVLIDAKAPNLQPLRDDNLVSALVYSAVGNNVKMVIANGRVIYDRDRDYEKFVDRALSISERLNDFIRRFI